MFRCRTHHQECSSSRDRNKVHYAGPKGTFLVSLFNFIASLWCPAMYNLMRYNTTSSSFSFPASNQSYVYNEYGSIETVRQSLSLLYIPFFLVSYSFHFFGSVSIVLQAALLTMAYTDEAVSADGEPRHAPPVSHEPPHHPVPTTSNLDRAAIETTPFLSDNTNAALYLTPSQRNKWFNLQTLSGLSILICLGLSLIGWLMSATLYTAISYNWPPYYLYHPVAVASQIVSNPHIRKKSPTNLKFQCFWTGFPSLINYTRLKRSKRDLPWFINIPLDFFIAVISFSTGSWYTMRIISTPNEG